MAEDIKAAENDKPVEAASAAPGEKRSVGRPRKVAAAARASESGDAAVHQALAELQTAQMNASAHQDAADRAAEQNQGHEDAVKDARKTLADLGYE